MAKQKKEKEKIIYYDDNSTISDMSRVNRKGEPQTPPPRKQSTASEKWRTYWSAVRMMIAPMFVALGIIGILFLFVMLLSGNLF